MDRDSTTLKPQNLSGFADWLDLLASRTRRPHTRAHLIERAALLKAQAALLRAGARIPHAEVVRN